MLGEAMQVKLIDHMGSDLTVVNAEPRVSFAKVSEWDEIPFGDGFLQKVF